MRHMKDDVERHNQDSIYSYYSENKLSLSSKIWNNIKITIYYYNKYVKIL